MFGIIQRQFSGDGMGARVMRGSVLTFLGFGGGQFLRLLSNLILTRLLFPEAFGLMAIVSLFLAGLQMFSDVGLGTSIVRSKRGDDPVFLNTAWTLQVMRGVLLGLICCAIAGPVSRFYGEPILYELMFGLAFTVFIMEMRSTRIGTASRNIHLGRVTFLDLGCQSVAIVVMVVLAWVWETVWALVVGMMVQQALHAVLSHLVLPGHPNRLRLERAAFWELFHFGKYLFVSSGLTFIIENGDRMLLSKFFTLANLGFYNIAYFFGSVPLMLMGNFAVRVVYPLYSARPPAESEANRRALSKARFGLTGLLFAMQFVLALLGQWLIELLYTTEYWAAGPILVVMSVSLMPSLIIRGHAFVLLAVGRSGLFTAYQALRAVLQTGLLIVGVMNFGLIGALAAQPLAAILSYPVLYYLIRPYRAEDPLHDGVFMALTILCGSLAFWINQDALLHVLSIQ
ncbi:oligosaccharide flippase family protein [uncultured Tateyamaria sp.]|uniref:oligosaccharide flippase family protein n=1 Tax=uncultured Tateyamaria sp. TaxID=455651 RepID=UPI00261E6696|nr:oligosaccharide flippase family protein [uncultured Tateyamaria sp.]